MNTFSTSDKNYIRKKIRQQPLEEIARHLNVSEDDVLKYLKKRWRKEKYERYVKRNLNTSRKKPFLLKKFIVQNKYYFLLLFGLVVFCYFNSLNNEFVSDDIFGISQNERIGSFSAIFEGSFSGYFGSFLRYSAFKIGGLNPAFFRLPNVLFHLGSTLALFTLLGYLFNKRIAIFAAAIFAVHPILTEAVTWISGGPYSHYSFFFLLSFLTYLLAKDNRKYYSWSLIFFGLALLSSTNAAVVFLIFPLYEFSQGTLKQTWKKWSPYAIIGVLSVIFFLSKIGQRSSGLETTNYEKIDPVNPFIQVPIAITNYLKLMVWPQNLSFYHTELVFSKGQFAIILFAFLIFVAGIVYAWKKSKWIFFWLLFFLVTLLPTLMPFGVSWIIAERYVYLGSIGIFAVVAIGFNWLLEKSERTNKAYMQGLYIILAIAIVALSVRTIIRNQNWQNQDTLWIATAETSPSGFVIHNNLGDMHVRQGNLEKGIEEFQKAIEINPGYAAAYHNIGNTYQKNKQYEEAVKSYEKAVEIDPSLWQTYQNLTAIYLETGNVEKALESIREAIKINPADQRLREIEQLIMSETNK